MTRLITSAAKLSPLLMSCGFSSEKLRKSGSTMQNEGSRPESASAKNRSMLRTWAMYLTIPSG